MVLIRLQTITKRKWKKTNNFNLLNNTVSPIELFKHWQNHQNLKKIIPPNYLIFGMIIWKYHLIMQCHINFSNHLSFMLSLKTINHIHTIFLSFLLVDQSCFNLEYKYIFYFFKNLRWTSYRILLLFMFWACHSYLIFLTCMYKKPQKPMTF